MERLVAMKQPLRYLVALHCGATAPRPSGPVFVRTLSGRIAEHATVGSDGGSVLPELR